jgi:predicted DNA-binding transcriptional regulator AlpA
MENAVIVKRQPDPSNLEPYENRASGAAGIVVPFESRVAPSEIPARKRMSRQLVSTKELSAIWGVPESTLRYWRSAETGPTYVKLGRRIKYDLADVERYVRANKRMPSVRAHGG